MTMPLCRASFTALLLASAFAVPSSAQIKASERGSVSQTVDGTTLTVDYSRPQARGRTLFGGLVAWDYMWTPGANWATTLDVSGPIRLVGEVVPAGIYSLWMQAQPDAWRVHLHPNPRLYHTGEYPSDGDFQVSVTVPSAQADHYAEVLTFTFPDVRRDGGVLRLHWGETAIDMPFEVEPSQLPFAMAADEMAPFLGAYEGQVSGGGGTEDVRMVIAGNDGRLEATIPMWGDATFALLPTADAHRFLVGWLRDGEVVQVEDEPALFEIEDGAATSLVIMGIRNQPWFTLRKSD
ncbi:MAG TPA: DUF2911 domain-containing protein [Longimicrobiales bacterium]|nr:DUF2911 domain-containing protein [Longimicrobiales bacterium]